MLVLNMRAYLKWYALFVYLMFCLVAHLVQISWASCFSIKRLNFSECLFQNVFDIILA